MNWLHTWTGLVLGGLLFAIFWTGTLSVFDREIDLWMKPVTRIPAKQPASIDAVARELRPIMTGVQQWYVLLPTEREPALRIGYRAPNGGFVSRSAESSGRLLPDPGTWAGTRFIYPFHYNLHIRFWSLGYWIVGFAAMAMMSLCVSGVVIHRKILTDFFTFRPGKKPRRLTLDLHNVTGVLGLPFHFAISLSGLIIFYSIYFPSVRELAYDGDGRTFNQEAFGTFERPEANAPAAPSAASLDRMVAEASRVWAGSASFVRIWYPGDAASYVEVRRSVEESVTMMLDVAYFDAATGVLLHRFSPPPVVNVQRFISGLHFIQFRHWTLRWAYFGLGLTGCVLIATGYLFWLEARRKKHAALGLSGVRVVESLTMGSVIGILLATLGFFVVNRLLPLGATFAGYDRAALEIWTFYLVWLATFVHAWTRPVRAWREQCGSVAFLAALAVLLNWVTTGDHLVRSLSHRYLWPIAGVDMLLLLCAVIALAAAYRLRKQTSLFNAVQRKV